MTDILHENVPDPDGEQYPRRDGEVTVLGPEIFASADGEVISWKGRNYVLQHAPEPAGDGPGWDRPGIEAAAKPLPAGLRRQVEALLADRDRLEARDQAAAYHPHSGQQQVRELVGERDAARAELAEVTAERDRLHGVAERTMSERRDATAEVTEARAAGTTWEELLATARRDAAADALVEAARIAYGYKAAPSQVLQSLAAEIRSGSRPAPGSPQPADEGGGGDAE